MSRQESTAAAKRQAGTNEPAAAPVRDLRDWLARVQAMGELVTIDQPVDPAEEMSGITYLVAKQQPSPAVLFRNPRGYEEHPLGISLLWNNLGPSMRRTALTLGEPPDLPVSEIIRRAKDKMKRRIPPREVGKNEAPVYENTILARDLDLTSWPIPRHWPLDGGRYAGTADAVITRDPDSGYLNVGTYRMMVQGKSQTGLYLSPGKDAGLHIARAWQKREPIQVAAAWGIEPLFMVCGALTFPSNISEYEFIGGIRGEAVPVVRGTTTDLLIPANAEIVVEGVIRPDSMKREGPFGEFTGYYGRPEGECPLVEITAVHHRTRPILTNALMADYPSCEEASFMAVTRSSRIWDDLEKLGVPGIKGIYSHPAAAIGVGMTVISLEQRYAGHAAQVLALAAEVPAGAYYTKWIIAVDEDVDPTSMDEVISAMATRCNPVDDIDIRRSTWSTYLDPTQNPPEKRPYGSRALINACKEHRHLKVFSKRTALRREMYDQVAARWRELGLPGQVPQVLSFEGDAKPR